VFYALKDKLAPDHGTWLSKQFPLADSRSWNRGHLGIFADLQIFIDELLKFNE